MHIGILPAKVALRDAEVQFICHGTAFFAAITLARRSWLKHYRNVYHPGATGLLEITNDEPFEFLLIALILPNSRLDHLLNFSYSEEKLGYVRADLGDEVLHRQLISF